MSAAPAAVGGGYAGASGSDALPVAKTSVGDGLSAEGAISVLEDRAWALKRDWTDHDFQDGAEANKALLQKFEDDLVSRLRGACGRASAAAARDASQGASSPAASSAQASEKKGGDVVARMLAPILALKADHPEKIKEMVLEDPEVLGSSLDIVGAYLKNYEVDKAARVIETVLPMCRRRGGYWLLKALNHLSTVRMKQSRPLDALAALEEVDAYMATYLRPEERKNAWEFWENVYRNFGWVLSSLDRTDEAVRYIERAVEVKEEVGREKSWFDLWDIGRFKGATALRLNEAGKLKEAQAIVTKALWLHRDAEPNDLVMRAKIWHSVGEGSFALGHLAEGSRADANPNGCATSSEALGHYKKALKCFREAHKLFSKTEGRYNPLTGTEAQAVSWTLLRVGELEEAKGFLFDALESSARQQSGWGDGQEESAAPALSQAMLTVERILEAHRRTDDREGLVKYFDAIEKLLKNVCGRLRLSKAREDAPVYEKLISSCSMVMVASGTPEGTQRSQLLLRTYMWDSPDSAQARLCNGLLNSIGDGRGTPDTTLGGPAMAAIMEALKQSGGADLDEAELLANPAVAAMLGGLAGNR
eukprot:TRINITY_DN19773_c0_g1_i1.p1 TRINITY_DN19773_c0_g1~~TRINITY_DN19773_c0_g1_i1.p1  ORF type:complete len:607 (-),score=192.51 TRINITY_DN19773_c0_g1_i1:476-2248(-)